MLDALHSARRGKLSNAPSYVCCDSLVRIVLVDRLAYIHSTRRFAHRPPHRPTTNTFDYCVPEHEKTVLCTERHSINDMRERDDVVACWDVLALANKVAMRSRCFFDSD